MNKNVLVIAKQRMVKEIIRLFNIIDEDVSYNEKENLLLIDGGLLCYQTEDGIVFNTDLIPNKALSLIELFFDDKYVNTKIDILDKEETK